MIYALRKLIAFVFLGGMFWFIYQDLDNLDKPWFMHALGLIAIVFAFFWLLIPMVVVRFRIAARRRQNLTRYGEWRTALGSGGLRPLESLFFRGFRVLILWDLSNLVRQEQRYASILAFLRSSLQPLLPR